MKGGDDSINKLEETLIKARTSHDINVVTHEFKEANLVITDGAQRSLKGQCFQVSCLVNTSIGYGFEDLTQANGLSKILDHSQVDPWCELLNKLSKCFPRIP
ncbi:hypothetical protein TNCV_3978121 [Trichonephila clavipes]|nr:hypothetical protein TNCV_3978121 [Trichonephila clavipes]